LDSHGRRQEGPILGPRRGNSQRFHERAQTKAETMSIIECLKGTQDINKLYTYLKAVQMQKQERQDELDPLQEQAVQMIAQLEE
jgi:hypothetical protein